MDYTITPAPRRSLVRRLGPWAASLGLFAGGGYGVYRYAVPGAASAQEATPTTASATESTSGSLLAALPRSSAPAKEGMRYTTPFDPPAARYGAAPALPPAPDDEGVTTPRSATAVEAPVNPFAALPAGNAVQKYGYAAAPVAASTSHLAPAPSQAVAAPTPNSSTPVDAAAADDDAELARGQEPTNPLRAPAASPATPVADEADQARAAFKDADAVQSAETTGASSELLPVGESARYAAPPSYADPAADEAEPQVADATAAASAAPLSTANPFAAASAPPASRAVEPTPAHSALPAYAGPAYAAPQTEPSSALAYPSSIGPTNDAITPTPGLATADGTGHPGERILEGLQSPALTIQKSAPPEIQVGKKCTFYVRVTNNSQRTAHSVRIADEVPLGTQLVGTAPKAAVSGAQVVWDVGTLSPGEERVLEMELMPTAEGELGSVATVTFASQASAKARSTRPQLALRLTANPRVMIGEQQVVQVEITNPGSGDATGVMLLENIPQGVSHEAGPALEFEVGTLHPGETKRLELMLKANEAGLVDNVMTARADANLQVQANCQFEVIAPELKVSIEGPAKRILERPATYSVKVDNPGTAAAREVQLVTKLPQGMKFVSANNYGEYDAATHSVFWSLDELPANQDGTVELTTLAVEAVEQTLHVATRAQQGLEDSAETRVLVEGIVALGFEVQDVEDAIAVGDETTYEIRVTNQGSKAATNVQVVAGMPAGLRAQLGQGDARYTVQGDRVVFAPIPQIAPKAEATLRFRVQGLRAGDQRVTLQVTTDEVRDPIIEVESTQVYADE